MTEKKIAVIHGPNLNMLGKREPEIYGSLTLGEINAGLVKTGADAGFEVNVFQSNHEGAIVDKIQEYEHICKGMIINPAAYTHTSIAIRDALLIFKAPVIEVHLSNIDKREAFRHKSLIADIAEGRIAGFGALGYTIALKALMQMLNNC